VFHCDFSLMFCHAPFRGRTRQAAADFP
jgi:hypothetical protein